MAAGETHHCTADLETIVLLLSEDERPSRIEKLGNKAYFYFDLSPRVEALLADHYASADIYTEFHRVFRAFRDFKRTLDTLR
jgi:hypothetical protein